jgi:hypothetical protein
MIAVLLARALALPTAARPRDPDRRQFASPRQPDCAQVERPITE